MIAERRLIPALIPGLYTFGFLMLWIPAGLAYFLSDDFSLIRNVQTGGLFGIWSGSGSRFFRPVISMSIFMDHLLWGVLPVGYHLSNLLFHLANSILVYFLVIEIQNAVMSGGQNDRGVASRAALLFLVLPSHGEAIFWISARTDLIATVFFQMSLIAGLRTLTAPSIIPILISWATAAIAYLSKESALTLLPLYIAVMLLSRYPRCLGNTYLRSGIIQAGGHAALLTAFWIWRYDRIGDWIGGYGLDIHIPVLNPAKLINIPIMMCRSLMPYQSDRTVFVLSVASTLLLVLVVMMRMVRETRRTILGTSFRYMLLLAISLLPVFPLGTSITDMQGERLVYAPSVFSVCLLSLWIKQSVPGKAYHHIWLLIPGLCLAFLARSSVIYAQAGQLSKEIVSEICSLEPVNLALINLPDNLRGAYIFRSCLPDALIISCDRQVAVSIYCTHPIDSRNTVIDSNLDPRWITLRFPAEWMTRPDFNVLPGRTGDIPARISENQLRISWDTLPVNAIPIMYSGGALHRLTRPEVPLSASVTASPLATLEVTNH